MTDKFIDISLYVAYTLLVISILAVVILPLINALGNPKSLLKGLVGIGGIAVVFLIAYAFSSGTVTPDLAKVGYGEMASKIISAGLISLYILLIGSFVGIFVSEIINLFK